MVPRAGTTGREERREERRRAGRKVARAGGGRYARLARGSAEIAGGASSGCPATATSAQAPDLGAAAGGLRGDACAPAHFRPLAPPTRASGAAVPARVELPGLGRGHGGVGHGGLGHGLGASRQRSSASLRIVAFGAGVGAITPGSRSLEGLPGWSALPRRHLRLCTYHGGARVAAGLQLCYVPGRPGLPPPAALPRVVSAYRSVAGTLGPLVHAVARAAPQTMLGTGWELC